MRLDLFLISFLTLFLELTCIRWFPSHVLFVSRLQNTVRAAFGNDAVILNLPSRDQLNADDNLGGDFTMLIAGGNAAIRDAFARPPEYWLRMRGPFDN